MMKKKSKKLLLWLFVLTFVLTGIAGCGTKQKDDQEAASTEMPLTVVLDAHGGDLYEEGPAAYLAAL